MEGENRHWKGKTDAVRDKTGNGIENTLNLRETTGTGRGKQALEGENRHWQGKTGTGRGKQALTGENRH